MKTNAIVKYAFATLLAYSAGVAAEQVTVDVTATITNVYDPYGVISDVTTGNAVSGTYTYETTTPDQDPTFGIGFYRHGTGTGQVNLTSGNYRFKTNPYSGTPLEMHIMDEAWSPGEEGYHFVSFENEPTNGADIYNIDMDLYGNQGNALNSETLTSSPPNPLLFNINRNIYIGGMKNGYYFYIEAKVDSLGNSQSGNGNSTRFTYKMTARVNYVDDYMGSLNGKIKINDVINAAYTVDSTTPGVPDYDMMLYTHAPGTGAMSVEFGGVTLQTRAGAATPEARVRNGAPAEWDLFVLSSNQLVSSDPMIGASLMDFVFDGPGSALNSDALVTDNNLQQWYGKHIYVNGNNWWMDAEIISMELVPSRILEVVPGDTYLHPAQRFDAAFNVANSAPIVGISGNLNGMDISYYLQWACETYPPIENVQSVVCRDTHMMLMPGRNSLHFQLNLLDGTSVSKDVTWTRPGSF